MGGVVDTNLLLYAANTDAPEHAAAHRFLASTLRSSERWYLSEGILYEFLRVATHPRVFPAALRAADAVSFLEPLLASPAYSVLVMGDAHWESLRETLKPLRQPAGNIFFDIRTVALMREHGVSRLYTADHDFLQFDGIRVVNPLRSD